MGGKYQYLSVYLDVWKQVERVKFEILAVRSHIYYMVGVDNSFVLKIFVHSRYQDTLVNLWIIRAEFVEPIKFEISKFQILSYAAVRIFCSSQQEKLGTFGVFILAICRHLEQGATLTCLSGFEEDRSKINASLQAYSLKTYSQKF